MNFDYTLQTLDGIKQLHLQGRLDSATSMALEKTINTLFESNQERALIDFSGLSYISSAGLRLILVAAKRARQCGGKLILCNLAPTVREVFEISGFLKIMETADSQAAAIALLQAA